MSASHWAVSSVGKDAMLVPSIIMSRAAPSIVSSTQWGDNKYLLKEGRKNEEGMASLLTFSLARLSSTEGEGCAQSHTVSQSGARTSTQAS